ncbi:hypothetical protein B0H17DRAFT_1150027 [Mycena rosella]|uniref:Uncharacterized protein n=1 Tax=Mycena rosella TaxID=1033263 RepID=A0AAD7BVQ0_MYCRO|nr:hypothetical protein B0H17DRAFT_1150027 [Mycena rosella]
MGSMLVDHVHTTGTDNVPNMEPFDDTFDDTFISLGTFTENNVVDDTAISVKDSDEEYEGSNTDTVSDGSEEEDDDLDAAVSHVVLTVKISPKFPNPFEVPYKNGTQDLNGIMLCTDFDDFFITAAAQKDTRLSLMSNIGYALISDVSQHIKASKAKNRGKGEVKPFSISLIDLSKAAKSGAGKKGKKSKSEERGNDQPTPALKEHKLAAIKWSSMNPPKTSVLMQAMPSRKEPRIMLPTLL